MADSPPALRCRARGPRPFLLSRRSPTLSGNAPLRAVQACPPYLAGNAFGWQLSPPAPIRLWRGLRTLRIEPPPLSARRLGPDHVELRLDTGLSVEPADGVVLSLERAYNRRDRRVAVREELLAVPAELHLTLVVELRRRDGEISLAGELASLGAFAAAPGPLLLRDLSQAQDLGRAHLSFFDASYFQRKRAAPTRRYRRRSGRETAAAAEGAPIVALAGGPAPAQSLAGGILALALPLEVPARLSYHGQQVEAQLPAPALQRRARAIEARWREVFGDEAAPEVGAVRYFTTYVTPHSAGDPHLFFKPAVLLRTPPGWSAVLDGPAGPGYEVLRGVTEADWFPALPAVVELQGPQVSLPAGAPLLRVRPVPRALLERGVAWD